MAELWLRTGLNPDDPDALVLAVVVNQDGTPGERAAARLGSHGYEGDGCFTLVQTDGWAEHRLDGEVLTVDIVASPAVLEALGIGTAGFPERSAVDPDAVRLLRVSAQVVPADHERAWT
ncbi:hypothetical protein GCM10023085_05340 [Actinomadura viridis]|uniref:Uncharacterized protein n=1 Tax=Actinomadura viridis TaxID=58110 RepID=A0A931GLD1_9ACTN|nr:hypothetical protein [Actinomadura viridis]MBG6091352.1 hypothetical protein [Actinomadura viridis]